MTDANARHITMLKMMKDRTPVYAGGGPKPEHYQAVHAAFDAAILALSEQPQESVDAVRVRALNDVAQWYEDIGWNLDEEEIPDAIRTLDSASERPAPDDTDWTSREDQARYLRSLNLVIPCGVTATPASQPQVSDSDWFRGEVDADGNELVTLRSDDLANLKQAIQIIRASVLRYQGQPNLYGEIFKIADSAFTPAPQPQVSAQPQVDEERARAIADFLIDQQDEPWPGGTDSDRLHYWRNKAIEGANRIRSLASPEGVEP